MAVPALAAGPRKVRRCRHTRTSRAVWSRSQRRNACAPPEGPFGEGCLAAVGIATTPHGPAGASHGACMVATRPLARPSGSCGSDISRIRGCLAPLARCKGSFRMVSVSLPRRRQQRRQARRSRAPAPDPRPAPGRRPGAERQSKLARAKRWPRGPSAMRSSRRSGSCRRAHCAT